MSKSSRFLYAIIAVLIVMCDQISKGYVRLLTVNQGDIKLTNFFNIISTWNSGVSFGILHTIPFSNWLFIFVTSAIIIILFVMLLRSSSKTTNIGWVVVISGALGNLIDRLRFGAVYDFLDFHLYGWHWPAFNVADLCVFVGVLVLLIREYDKKN